VRLISGTGDPVPVRIRGRACATAEVSVGGADPVAAHAEFQGGRRPAGRTGRDPRRHPPRRASRPIRVPRQVPLSLLPQQGDCSGERVRAASSYRRSPPCGAQVLGEPELRGGVEPQR